MMKKFTLLLCLLFTGTVCLFLPKQALAFGCTSNGISIGGVGTYTIPIDVTLTKTSSSIILTDMSAYTTCNGVVTASYQDALKISSTSISSAFSAIGFSGFAVVYGTSYNFPVPGVCIWPDAACSLGSGSITSPVGVKLGIQRLTPGKWNATTLPAGTEVARLSALQRGNYGGANPIQWGNSKTWIFTLKNPLSIPSYSCAWTNPNPTVSLPPVKKADLEANGVGRYPVAKPFNINLTCDPQTTVSIQLDGTTMAGKNNVLANASPGNTSAGIQVTFNGNPVVYGQRMQVITNSQAQESLAFNAYYYYNGGALVPGSVSAVTTVTLTYN